ncbi:hypothetical protein [Agromyces sp. LHK192]|uniref:hypothetical protein n=1 Tax=Agromyces sp. LHK192 TaxID=2498704 RepID=UPI000FDC34E5|nr:hypothetical protein [Agromyces sp. LHK192]
MAGDRPGGVTLVAVLAWISGALQIISGLFQILPGGGNFGAGVWAIILGIVTIIVSLGLFRGSNVARIIVTVIFVINIATGIWLMTVGSFWTGLFSALFPLIGLLLLWSKRANAFFS